MFFSCLIGTSEVVQYTQKKMFFEIDLAHFENYEQKLFQNIVATAGAVYLRRQVSTTRFHPVLSYVSNSLVRSLPNINPTRAAHKILIRDAQP